MRTPPCALPSPSVSRCSAPAPPTPAHRSAPPPTPLGTAVHGTLTIRVSPMAPDSHLSRAPVTGMDREPLSRPRARLAHGGCRGWRPSRGFSPRRPLAPPPKHKQAHLHSPAALRARVNLFFQKVEAGLCRMKNHCRVGSPRADPQAKTRTQVMGVGVTLGSMQGAGAVQKEVHPRVLEGGSPLWACELNRTPRPLRHCRKSLKMCMWFLTG